AWRSPGANDGSVTPPTYSFDLLMGFRYADLSEGLAVNGTTVFAANQPQLGGATVTTSDSFGTHNHLFGGQIGADAGFRWNRLGVNLYTKVAFADNQQSVNVNGLTDISGPAALGALLGTHVGGYYAQASNIGHYNRDPLSVL